MSPILRRTITLTAAAALVLAGATPAFAGGTRSQGHGVKCGWTLDKVVDGANYWKWTCWKGA